MSRYRNNFLREKVQVNGNDVPAAVDVASCEVILLMDDLPADAGLAGLITLGGRECRCRPWRTSRGVCYLIVALGTDPPPIDGLVE